MSKFIFYKVPFEGKIEAVYNLIKNQDWDVLIKMPEKGIIYMKVPEEADEEVSFHQNLMFDDNTNSKFGFFEKITESDFESAQKNIEIPSSVENKKPEANKKIDEIDKNIKNYQKEKEIFDKKISQLSAEKNQKDVKVDMQLETCLSYLNNMSSMQIFKAEELGKKIYGNYKDPYDYFFSHNYLIALFIFAIICLIVLDL